MLTKKNGTKVLRRLKKITKKRLVNIAQERKKLIITQFIIAVILLIEVTCSITYVAPFLEQFVSADGENWAVALIAMPIALFGVWLSLFLPTLEKYNKLFCQKELTNIYGSAIHPFDFEKMFTSKSVLDFTLWIFAYFEADSGRMIVLSLVMSFDFLYLICFTIWKHKQRPATLYWKNIMEDYFKLIFKGSTGQPYDDVERLLKNNNIKELEKKTEQEHSYFFDEIDSLMMLIIGDKTKEDEKEAFLNTLSELNKLPFQETNIVITHIYLNKVKYVIKNALDNNDYLFAKKLADQYLVTFDGIIIKTCHCLTDFLKVSREFINHINDATLKQIKEFSIINSEVMSRFNLVYKVVRCYSDDITEIICMMKGNEVTSKHFYKFVDEQEVIDMYTRKKEALDQINCVVLEHQESMNEVSDSLELTL